MLAWDASEYGDIQAVVYISLCALDCTTAVESGWGTMNYIKGLHSAHGIARVMNDYLLALLQGPPLAKWNLARKMESKPLVHTREACKPHLV